MCAEKQNRRVANAPNREKYRVLHHKIKMSIELSTMGGDFSECKKTCICLARSKPHDRVAWPGADAHFRSNWLAEYHHIPAGLRQFLCRVLVLLGCD